MRSRRRHRRVCATDGRGRRRRQHRAVAVSRCVPPRRGGAGDAHGLELVRQGRAWHGRWSDAQRRTPRVHDPSGHVGLQVSRCDEMVHQGRPPHFPRVGRRADGESVAKRDVHGEQEVHEWAVVAPARIQQLVDNTRRRRLKQRRVASPRFRERRRRARKGISRRGHRRTQRSASKRRTRAGLALPIRTRRPTMHSTDAFRPTTTSVSPSMMDHGTSLVFTSHHLPWCCAT